MLKHQEEYIKLLDEKFGVVGIPKKAYYSYGKIPDRGILVELKCFPITRIFISDKPKSYYHKWTTEINSEHLPNCVWLTSKSNENLGIDKGFYI